MKKIWKIIIGLLVICGLAVVVVPGVRKENNPKSEEAESTVAIQVGVGEQVEYASLTTVRGNEITYLLAEKGDAVSTGNDRTGKTDRADKSESGRGNSSGFGGGFSGMGSMMSGTESEDGTFVYDGFSYTLTETKVTELIPVGTQVTTKLGTVTTFSRLRAGDNVAIVRDKSSGEIVAVYIVG